MSVATILARRVLDEEIERHGSWWATENCWHVVRGEGACGELIDQLTPVFEAAAARTGIPVARLEGIFRPSRALMQPGAYLATSHAHRERRMAEGRLRLVDRAAEPGRNLFEYVEPVS